MTQESHTKTVERLAIISDVTTALLMSREPQLIINDLCKKIMDHLDCDVFLNYLVDNEKNCLRLSAYAGISEESADRMRVLDFETVCGSVVRDARAIVAENVPATPDERTDFICSLGVKAYACYPLFAQGEVIGTLSFGTRSRLSLAEDELALMKTVADHVAVALERTRLLQSAETKAEEFESKVRERTKELQQVVESASKSRQRLFDVLESLPVYVVLLAPDYTIPFSNRVFQHLFGDPGNKKCYAHLFSRTEPCETCQTYVTLKTAAPQHWSWTGPNGRIYDIRDYPFTDTDGSPLILEMGMDITDQKRAEEELHCAFAYNRSLIEASLDPLVTIDHEGKISDVNTATERITGYSRTKLIGTDFSDYFTEPEKARAGYQLVFRDGMVRDYELHIRHYNGQVTPVLYNASVYKDESGTVIGVFAVARDISKRRAVEEALAEAEEAYRTAIESAPDGIALTREGIHIYANRKFAEIFGYTDIQQVIGKPLSLVIHPEDSERVAKINHMREDGETVPLRYQFKGLKKDGTSSTIEIFATRTTYRGKPVTLSFLRDVTDYKRLEEELRQSHKMEALGTLTGGIAHDFNNILAGILGFAEMAREDAPADGPLQYHLERVIKGAMRGRDLVKQMLTFSRKTEYDIKALPIVPIIEETLKLLRASIPTTIQIEFTTTAKKDVVVANATGVQQIILNLATNAAHAMRENGGKLSVSLSDAYDESSPFLALTVRDTGTGMPPEVLKRVFEPFFTTKEAGHGTGMGLAVVYGIVRSFGGDISVHSTEGHGTVFQVYFPRAVTDASSDTESPVLPPSGNEHILFVDDEETLVDLGKRMLERLGYKVAATTSSVKALKMFIENPASFDLVITDHTMPELTGLRFAEKLLAMRPDLPIILCTGFSESLDPEKVKEAGIKQFLMKPLTKAELAAAVRRVLDHNKHT
ncbi:MAG TPA: PAS domain S-box protein [Syntrophorhabdaceae bacterium]|nr:PAS domain S-box protein [Syntrophorhabdaceae bacterium]